MDTRLSIVPLLLPLFCFGSQVVSEKYLNGGHMEEVVFHSYLVGEKDKPVVRTGILYTNPKAKATVLVCHGFMCDKIDAGFLRKFLFNDYNVFIFDFRAHGAHIKPEHCCTFGRDEAFDVLGAVQYLRNRPDLADLPLFAYGFSMGAVAAIQAAAFAKVNLNKDIFAGLILDCPYDNSQNVIKRAIENLKFTILGFTFNLPGKSLLERYAFNPWVQWVLKTALKTIAHLDATATNTYIYPVSPARSLKNIYSPCFFIHCFNDEKVTVQAARNVYASARGYKRLWITQGRRHFDSIFYNPEKYVRKVNRFMEQALNGELERKAKKQKILSDVKLVKK
jgi:pimeloyl-ACP methyl ester carboxylesterase